MNEICKRTIEIKNSSENWKIKKNKKEKRRRKRKHAKLKWHINIASELFKD